MKHNHLTKKNNCVFTPVMHVHTEDFNIEHSNAKEIAAANTQKNGIMNFSARSNW